MEIAHGKEGSILFKPEYHRVGWGYEIKGYIGIFREHSFGILKKPIIFKHPKKVLVLGFLEKGSKV